MGKISPLNLTRLGLASAVGAWIALIMIGLLYQAPERHRERPTMRTVAYRPSSEQGLLSRLGTYRRRPLSWWQLSQKIEQYELNQYRSKREYRTEANLLKERILLSGYDPEIEGKLSLRLQEALVAHERRGR